MTRITFGRLARSLDVSLITPATTDDELVDAVTEFARQHLRSPRFAVRVDGDRVLVSSLATANGPDAGDFGVGHITRGGSS